MSDRPHILPRWYRRAIVASTAVIFVLGGSWLFLLGSDVMFYVYLALMILAAVTYLPALVVIAMVNGRRAAGEDSRV